MIRLAWIAAALLLLACGGRVPGTADPGEARRLVAETAPDRPLRVIFSWRVLDGDARFSGRGAARIEPPYRARLDLFGPRGEGYLSAAVVGSQLRVPARDAEVLPPPAMVWAVLGTVRPPEHAVLQGTRRHEGRAELHYRANGGRLRYAVVEGRLRSAEWSGSGRRMVVELTGGMSGLPATAAYRDWTANTELHIELESVEDVEPYPPEIWDPGR